MASALAAILRDAVYILFVTQKSHQGGNPENYPALSIWTSLLTNAFLPLPNSFVITSFTFVDGLGDCGYPEPKLVVHDVDFLGA